MSAPTSFIERMVRVRNVAWSRLPSGMYYVEWMQDGVRELRTFRTAGAAQEYAAWLSTVPQANVKEVRVAERALRDLEETVEYVEREEAEQALRDLELTMVGLGYRPAGRVPVVRHRRRRARSA